MKRDKPHVVFYTKPGCHLCEEAKREIESAGREDLYTFEEVNILSDASLLSRYGTDIPVVVINGVHMFKHRVTAREFLRALGRTNP